MITVRHRILNYLSEQQIATVEELSRVFKVTPANIRHHLSILIDQGSVCVIGMRPAPNKGRPSQVYACTQQTNQNNLDQLADVLLCLIKQDPQLSPDSLYSQLADQLVSKFPLDTHNPTRRLYSSIRVLNRMNYRAHWEAHIENPRIMLSHCPYSKLIDTHPDICHLDAFVLEALLGARVNLVERLSLNARGLPQCIFLLNKASGNS